jgi:hypothetical protein
MNRAYGGHRRDGFRRERRSLGQHADRARLIAVGMMVIVIGCKGTAQLHNDCQGQGRRRCGALTPSCPAPPSHTR